MLLDQRLPLQTAWSITRRELPVKKVPYADLDAIYDEPGGGHSGHDCFVIPAAWMPRLPLGDMTVGFSPWGCVVYRLLESLGEVKTLHDQFLTYHLTEYPEDMPKGERTRLKREAIRSASAGTMHNTREGLVAFAASAAGNAMARCCGSQGAPGSGSEGALVARMRTCGCLQADQILSPKKVVGAIKGWCYAVRQAPFYQTPAGLPLGSDDSFGAKLISAAKGGGSNTALFGNAGDCSRREVLATAAGARRCLWLLQGVRASRQTKTVLVVRGRRRRRGGKISQICTSKIDAPVGRSTHRFESDRGFERDT